MSNRSITTFYTAIYIYTKTYCFLLAENAGRGKKMKRCTKMLALWLALFMAIPFIAGHARGEEQDARWPWDPKEEHRNARLNQRAGTWGKKVLWTASAPIETRQGVITKSHSDSYTASATVSAGFEDIFGVSVNAGWTETLSTTVTLEAGWKCVWEAWTVGTLYTGTADKYVNGAFAGTVSGSARSPERIDDKVTFSRV